MDADARKLIKVALLANFWEWYEFSIYGFLAGPIAQLFFQSTHPILALIQVFGIFAASHLIRPLGSLFFGSLGDRVGRSYTLNISLVIMSIPAILIGMLPTYSQIGWLAPLGLLVLRLIQGFGIGGESSIIGCYVYETSPPQHKGMLCSSVLVSSLIGVLCGSFLYTLLVWIFSTEEIHRWAWRIPFLLGIPLTFYIFRVRQKLFKVQPALNENMKLKSTNPILSLLTTHRVQLLQYTALTACSLVNVYILVFWMPTYLVHFLGYSQKITSLTNTLTLCSMILFYLASGWLSDRISYKKLIVGSIIIIFSSVYALFLGLQWQLSWLSLLGIQLLLGLLISGIDPLSIRYLGDAFPKNIRASGMSISFTLVGSLFGSTAPLICTWSIYKTGLLIFPAFYIMAFCLLALPVALRLKTGLLNKAAQA